MPCWISPPARPAPRLSDPRLCELLTAQMDASAHFKDVSDRHALLIQQGDQTAADLFKPQVAQAKQDYEAIRAAFQAAKGQ